MDLPSLAHTLLSPYTPQHQRAEANASLVSMLQQDDLPYHANILVTQQTGYEFLGLTMMCEWIKIRGGKGCQEGVEEWAKVCTDLIMHDALKFWLRNHRLHPHL